MERETAYIIDEMHKLGISLTEQQSEQLYEYYKLLVEWNSFMNLTGITEFSEVVQKHFVDSLSIVKVKNMNEVDNLIDVGTGAGFPGLPLKIVFPHLKVTLLDSLNKRIDFLNAVIEKTGLTGIETIHGRAEDFAKPGLKREIYDLCVSRAVANLSTLSEYCLPYVKIGGEFIPYKSGEVADELQDAKSAVFLLGGKVESCENFDLPGSDIHRSLVRIKKWEDVRRNIPGKQECRQRRHFTRKKQE